MPYGSILLATMVAGLLGPVTDPPAANSIRLDGEKVSVYWNDGDSLRVRSGRHKGTRVRLMGYNTLESFGPVHSWGEWTGDDLWALQDEGTRFARSRVWTCKSGGERDHYKRLLVRCDDLVVAMVGAGYAHLFEMPGGTPDAQHLASQKKAIAGKKGMWGKGVPDGIVTSVHSIVERKDGSDAYNRVADPKTGVTRKVSHREKYGTCQKVCLEGSCMIYVPYKKRYPPDRAECLWVKKKKRGKAKP